MVPVHPIITLPAQPTSSHSGSAGEGQRLLMTRTKEVHSALTTSLRQMVVQPPTRSNHSGSETKRMHTTLKWAPWEVELPPVL